LPNIKQIGITQHMLWNELSWPQVDAQNRDTPVVIPLGSCEQHGHHLPVFVDTIQVQAVAEQVEKAMRDRILMLPAIWIGSSHHHIDYPGTISLPPELYTSLIKHIVLSVLRAGFKRLFFLNGHGGNEIPVGQALAALVAESDHADDAYLAVASWWAVGRDALESGKVGLTTPGISHACEVETSMMLAIRPDLVDMSKATEPGPVLSSKWFNFEYGGKVGVYRRYHRLSPSGNMGASKAATSEKGDAMLAGVVADVVRFLDEFARWKHLPKIGPK
jgi:creatinine amidohydrolase